MKSNKAQKLVDFINLTRSSGDAIKKKNVYGVPYLIHGTTNGRIQVDLHSIDTEHLGSIELDREYGTAHVDLTGEDGYSIFEIYDRHINDTQDELLENLGNMLIHIYTRNPEPLL